LIDVLVNEGAEVRAVIRGSGPASLPEGVKAVAADLSYPETVAPWLEGFTALFLHPAPSGSPQAACWRWPGNGGAAGGSAVGGKRRRSRVRCPGPGRRGDWRHAGPFLLSRGSEGGARE